MVTSRLACSRGLQKLSLTFTEVNGTGVMGYCAFVATAAKSRRVEIKILDLVIGEMILIHTSQSIVKYELCINIVIPGYTQSY